MNDCWNCVWVHFIPINPFVPKAPFPNPLKTSENHKVFLCFQGLEKGYIGKKCVKDERLLSI